MSEAQAETHRSGAVQATERWSSLASSLAVSIASLAFLVTPALAGDIETPESLKTDRGGDHSVTAWFGQATNTVFTQTIYSPWTAEMVDLYFVGGSVSYRLGTLGDVLFDPHLGSLGQDVTIEIEGGLNYHFGSENLGEGWAALYFRYDGFPWNDYVYTTFAINTGLSMLSENSDFERSRSDDQSVQLLHYFSPEITVADPEHKDLEFVLRLHHRSGMFGLFDGIWNGSSFVTGGIRYRF